MYARLRRLGLPLLLLCGACASSQANARHRVDMSVLTQDDLVDHQYQSDGAFEHVADLDGVTGITNEITVIEAKARS